MTIWGALLILLGTVAALALVCGRAVKFMSKHKNDAYDERQKMFQGKAYGFGLLVAAVYFMILSFGLLIVGDAKLPGDVLSLVVMAGVMLAYTAVNLYCLMTGALLPLNGLMDPVIGMSYFFAVTELFGLIVHICFHGMSMGDDPVGTWEDLTGVVFWTLHAVMYMIARRREKRNSDGQ